MASAIGRSGFTVLGLVAVLVCSCGNADSPSGDTGTTLGSGGGGAMSGASSSSTGASSSTGSTNQPPPPTPMQRPIVVAQGLVGRTTISCDDGKTWIANRSFDIEGNDLVCGDTTPVQCGTSPCKMVWTDGSCQQQDVCDCVHGTGYSKGVAIAKNQVLANFGWGWPGAVLRSQDGGSWDVTLALPMALYPNIVFGADRFVLYTGFKPAVSDDGINWQYTTPPSPDEGGRASAFLDYGEGIFLAASDGNVVRVSSDRGQTWHMAASIPAGCTDGIGNAQKILTGNHIAVMISSDNRTACRSADGGETWTLYKITDFTGGIFFQEGVFVNGKFLAWVEDWSANNGIRYSSDDGITWTETPTNGPIWLAAVGATTAGTILCANDQYEKQSISRSTDDGLTWTDIPTSAYVQSHAIWRFASGYVDENTLCP